MLEVDVSLSVTVPPTHILSGPETGPGEGLTVIFTIVKQLAGVVYVSVTVPADAPVTTPVEEPTVTLALLEVHVPPAGAELKVVD